MNPKTHELLTPPNLFAMVRPAAASRFPDIIGTFMGRDALALAISALQLTADDVVLLPAYFCGEVLRPFIGKTRVGFFDVRPDLAVDPDVIRKRLTSTVKAVLIINYFGFLQPYRREIKKVCSENGVVLIEDCAHSLLTTGAGETGDLSIYSFRKLLPVPDGGGLRVSPERTPVTPNYYPGIVSAALSLLVVARSLVDFKSDFLSRAWFVSKQTTTAPPSGTSVHRNGRTMPLSVFSANGIGHSSFPPIIQKRRDDYLFWQSVSRKLPGVTPAYESLPPEVCPFGYPAKVEKRDDLRTRLDALGIRVSVEWRLPPSVGSEFVNSRQLSTQMLTLPVHPGLGSRARQRVLESFSRS